MTAIHLLLLCNSAQLEEYCDTVHFKIMEICVKHSWYFWKC